MGSVKPLFGTPINPAHPLSKGLVGCWLFNEMSGNKAYDSSGQQNTVTLFSGISDPPTSTSGWNAGPNGGGIAVDGGAYLQLVPKSCLKLTTTMTLHARFIPRIITGAWRRVIETNNAVLGISNITYGIYFGIWNSLGGQQYISGDPPLTIDRLNVITGTFDGTNLFIYLNGVKQSQTITQTVPLAAVTFVNLCGGGVPSPGLHSDIMIYNRALSAQEISYLYSQPYAMFEPELVNTDYLFNPSPIIGRF